MQEATSLLRAYNISRRTHTQKNRKHHALYLGLYYAFFILLVSNNLKRRGKVKYSCKVEASLIIRNSLRQTCCLNKPLFDDQW